MPKFEVQTSIDAQANYCKNNHLPHFAPYDGLCWNCNQNIYLPGKRFWRGNFDGRESEGISVDKASNELVTGCPHCFRSYCD
ncbi:hypothetical protein M3685_21940 [Heyndrickxia oleronia]|uniref:hypothetical protein n=1 Tax=Heyndrickxia oleronia TaxID=38875 RepID=UPI00203D3B7B|nr:hypothetical protein [Heyndrickxia oleronia]MCM3456565.1 hypothetical protein [Heyndrickxia oleronia]